MALRRIAVVDLSLVRVAKHFRSHLHDTTVCILIIFHAPLSAKLTLSAVIVQDFDLAIESWEELLTPMPGIQSNRALLLEQYNAGELTAKCQGKDKT